MEIECLFRNEELHVRFHVIVLLSRIWQRSLESFVFRVGQGGIDNRQRLGPSSDHASKEVETFQFVGWQVMLLGARAKEVRLPTRPQIPARVVVKYRGSASSPMASSSVSLKAEVDDAVDAFEAAPGEGGLSTTGRLGSLLQQQQVCG